MTTGAGRRPPGRATVPGLSFRSSVVVVPDDDWEKEQQAYQTNDGAVR